MSNWNQLKELSPDAFEFLKGFNPENYDDGRHELRNGMYINIELYKTHLRAEKLFEAHEKYIDVQYMIFGSELITVCSVGELECVEPYNQERDVSFYKNELKGIDRLLMSGEFLIFKPGEAHMPCICVNEQAVVRKAVLKIPVCRK